MPIIRRGLFYLSTSYRTDIYETSICTMSGYVARKYDNEEDIKMILSNFKIPKLENPEDLESMEDDADKDIYREYVKAYVKLV